MATLGRYELRGTLGEGGFATVYRAWDPIHQREVALKTLLPHLSANPAVRRRFIAEANALLSFGHRNIVTVYDVGDAGGRSFFAMELIEGRTLEQIALTSGQLPLPAVASIAVPLASAVDYLHAAGLIHRDIKAANVMVDSTGRVVLMDFGIARAVDATRYTGTGALLGTPEYVAPEQMRGEEVGPPADIYALGVLIYQLLAGRLPFVGELWYVLHAHGFDPPPPLRGFRPDLPAEIYAIVESALAKSSAERPVSAKALAAPFEPFLPARRSSSEPAPRASHTVLLPAQPAHPSMPADAGRTAAPASLSGARDAPEQNLVAPWPASPAEGPAHPSASSQEWIAAAPSPSPSVDALPARPSAVPAEQPFAARATPPPEQTAIRPSNPQSPSSEQTHAMPGGWRPQPDQPPAVPAVRQTPPPPTLAAPRASLAPPGGSGEAHPPAGWGTPLPEPATARPAPPEMAPLVPAARHTLPPDSAPSNRSSAGKGRSGAGGEDAATERVRPSAPVLPGRGGRRNLLLAGVAAAVLLLGGGGAVVMLKDRANRPVAGAATSTSATAEPSVTPVATATALPTPSSTPTPVPVTFASFRVSDTATGVEGDVVQGNSLNLCFEASAANVALVAAISRGAAPPASLDDSAVVSRTDLPAGPANACHAVLLDSGLTPGEYGAWVFHGANRAGGAAFRLSAPATPTPTVEAVAVATPVNTPVRTPVQQFTPVQSVRTTAPVQSTPAQPVRTVVPAQSTPYIPPSTPVPLQPTQTLPVRTPPGDGGGVPVRTPPGDGGDGAPARTPPGGG